MDIELYVFDLDFYLLGEISEYEELTIERHYTKVSKLNLRVATSKKVLERLQHDHILTTKDNPKYGYIIENFFYTDEAETEIEVHAYSLNWMLSWRSIITQQYYSGNVEGVIKAFINSNCINPSDTNRIIPNLRLAPNSGIDATVESSAYGLTVDEHCFAICNEHDMTIDVLMNHEDKKFDVVTWQGADRSTLQDENPHVIFSKEFDNIINQQYTNSKTDYKTTAIVAGEDWYDEGRLTVKINDDKSGYDRRELFIDSSLTSDYTDDEGYRNLLSEADYKKVLENEGKETLKDYEIIETFESEVDMYSQFEYVVDYGLGDIVSIRNDEINKIDHVRVINANLTSSRDGTQLNVNFGDPIPSPMDKIKKEVKSSGGVGGAGRSGNDGKPGRDGNDGVGLDYDWRGTELGVKREDESTYQFTDLQGPTGEQGPQGLQGPKGDKGDQGIQGPTGPQGERGPIGPEGLRGERGPQGLQGPKGDTGEQGPKGEKGDTGPVGPEGPKGDKGDKGDPGPQGPPGSSAIDDSYHWKYNRSAESVELREIIDDDDYGLSFDGNGATVDNVGVNNFNWNEGTWEFFVRTRTDFANLPTSYYESFFGVEQLNPSFRLRVYARGGASLYFTFVSRGGDVRIPSSMLTQHEWVHVAVTYSSLEGEMVAYLNGNRISSSSFLHSDTKLLSPFNIGQTMSYPSLNADMKEFRVWDKALSESEIQANMDRSLSGNENNLVLYMPMDEGTGEEVYDKSGNGNNGSINGAQWFGGSGANPSLLTISDTSVKVSGKELATKEYVDENAGGKPYHVGPIPPTNTDLIWIPK